MTPIQAIYLWPFLFINSLYYVLTHLNSVSAVLTLTAMILILLLTYMQNYISSYVLNNFPYRLPVTAPMLALYLLSAVGLITAPSYAYNAIVYAAPGALLYSTILALIKHILLETRPAKIGWAIPSVGIILTALTGYALYTGLPTPYNLAAVLALTAIAVPALLTDKLEKHSMKLLHEIEVLEKIVKPMKHYRTQNYAQPQTIMTGEKNGGNNRAPRTN